MTHHPHVKPFALLGTLFALLIVAACSSLPEVGPTEPESGITISGPFEQRDEGGEGGNTVYSGTVNQDSVTITGSQDGSVALLRFKLNETDWVEADLSSSDFSFPVTGLEAGPNTVAIRIDGQDGSITVIVIVIIFDPGNGAPPVVNSDPNPREMVALTENNTLVFFDSGSIADTTNSLNITGVEGTMLGIDFRPADGRLYGLSSTNKIYTIDIGSGVATEQSTLSANFTGRARGGVDFNPVPDRLRLTGSNNQNLRVNVDNGETIVDGTLAYNEGDTNEGLNPNITASAYTNSFDGTETTQLFNIDASLNILVLQDPPNDGGLITIGTLGIDFASVGGFDIFTDQSRGTNTAYAISESDLYTIDLATGSATLRGTVRGGPFQGLAVIPDPRDDDDNDVVRDPNPRDMVALKDNNSLALFNSGAPETVTTLDVTGVDGRLVGIDFRPADGRLYSLSTSNRIYTIDLESGEATEKSRLSERFEAGATSGFDFNPVPDRLRLTGNNEQNLRVNVDNGDTIVDGTLAYVEGDDNFGADPHITASAYINSFDGAEETTLFNIDAALDILVRQDPPNDGGLVTIGSLGIDFADVGGFDVITDDDRTNTAYALDSTLYLVDLETGATMSFGTVAEGPYQGLAIIPESE